MILQEYLDYIQQDYNSITYEIYCKELDLIVTNYISEGIFDNIKNMNLSRELVKIFSDLKNNLIQISKDFKIGLPDLVFSFKQRDVFSILKVFKFNISLIFRSIGELTSFVKKGLLSVFRELYKTGAVQRLRSGSLKVDEFLNKYPLLKKITGVAVAGLLLYIWLNMTFIGDLDYDFNFSSLAGALVGSFSITDLFISPDGLLLLTLFGTGTAFGLSIPWLGKTAYNLVLAIVYTAYYKIKKDDKNYKEMLKKLKSKIKMEKIK